MPKRPALIPYRTASQFGRQIWTARDRMNLTQAELAKRAGVGLKFLYQLEHGKETLRMDKVMDVLEVLSIQMVFLAQRSKSETP